MGVHQDSDMGSLVLTRCDGESFLVGADIEITVLEGRGGRARLAIRAPKDCRILRTGHVQREQQWIKR